MKLLFDQNLRFKLCVALAECYPGSAQVGHFGLSAADDDAVWTTAALGGFHLVSQDADFAEMALHRGPPPKIIWLRCGNRPTRYVARVLRRRIDILRLFERRVPGAVLNRTQVWDLAFS